MRRAFLPTLLVPLLVLVSFRVPQGETVNEKNLGRQLIERGLFELTPAEQLFAALPLMHSEDLADQERALEVLDRCVDQAPPEWKDLLADSREFARDHHNVIARFGRFPHRNPVLGRQSSREEEAFLADGTQGWGQ